MTWSVEIVGLVILSIWIVLPIREFQGIARRLREERAAARGTKAKRQTGSRA
jgi:hypothetical protein